MDMFLKDPGAVLDYQVDWAAAISGGQSVVDSSWSVSPVESGGLQVLDSSLGGAVARVRLGGGIAGHVYEVRNRAGFSDQTVDERSLTLRVEDR